MYHARGSIKGLILDLWFWLNLGRQFWTCWLNLWSIWNNCPCILLKQHWKAVLLKNHIMRIVIQFFGVTIGLYIIIQGVSEKLSFTELSICRFATNIRSISSQLAAGSPSAQFGKTQFFLDTLYMTPLNFAVAWLKHPGNCWPIDPVVVGKLWIWVICPLFCLLYRTNSHDCELP